MADPTSRMDPRVKKIATVALNLAMRGDWEESAAKDWEGFRSVLLSVPEGRPLGDGISALLNIVVSSLNNVETIRAATAKIQRGTS